MCKPLAIFGQGSSTRELNTPDLLDAFTATGRKLPQIRMCTRCGRPIDEQVFGDLWICERCATISYTRLAKAIRTRPARRPHRLAFAAGVVVGVVLAWIL